MLATINAGKNMLIKTLIAWINLSMLAFLGSLIASIAGFPVADNKKTLMAPDTTNPNSASPINIKKPEV
jgi:hypothetical protein